MNRRLLSTLVLLAVLLAVSASGAVRARGPAADAGSSAGPVPADWWAAAQEEIRRSEYQATWQGPAAAYQAPNRAHNLRTTFAPGGLRIVPRVPVEGAGWQLDLALPAYSAAGAAQLSVDGNRIEYRRGALTEWYVNDEHGLQQGFTLQSGEGQLVLDLALGGGLSPRMGDGTEIELVTAGGVPVLRLTGLHATDATGRELPVHSELIAAQDAAVPAVVRLVADAAGAHYPLTLAHTLAALAPATTWKQESDQAGAQYGTSVAIVGDVNGDGYDDLAVGAPYYDDGWVDRGEVFVYYGSATGPRTTGYDRVFLGSAAGARLGEVVAAAGDVNGDGRGDLIASEPGAGRVVVWYGWDTEPTSSWAATALSVNDYFGISAGTAGDVNGDGYDDIIVGAMNADPFGTDDAGAAYVWLGASAGLGDPGTPANADWSATSGQANARLGRSVGRAGDLNRDGYDDIVVGANYYDNGETDEGAIFIWYGSLTGLGDPGTPGNADWSAQGSQVNAYLGVAAGTAGDVDGDGYADLIAGASSYNGAYADGGRVYVFHGASAGLSCGGGCPVDANTAADWSADGGSGAFLGYAAATAGDVNGDGYDDVIAGAPYDDSGDDDAGRAFVYLGSAGGLAGDPAWSAGGGQAAEIYGWSVRGGGDVNGDGYDDFLAGAPFYDGGQADEGRAYLYYGSPYALDAQAAWTAVGGQKGAHLGYAVDAAGDVNGDGFSDVVIGVSSYDNPTSGGRVLVYYGSASGLPRTASWTATGDQGDAKFGGAVSTAGDFNGDGYADLAVGAPGYDDHGLSGCGAAFVYFGSAGGLGSAGSPSNADWAVYGDQAGGQLGYDLGTAGDVNRDNFDDLIVGAPFYNAEDGRVLVYHGARTPDTTADRTLDSPQDEANFGYAVDTAGDVNRDGYADVIVGAPHAAYAFAYYGSSTGLPATASWESFNTQADSQHGYAVSAAGDVNGDGYSDVLIGAPTYDSSGIDRGRVYLELGSATGLAGGGLWLADGGQPNARFGSAVSTAGDVNGDGYTDIIAGAPLSDGSGPDEGRVVLFYGAAGFPADSHVWAITGRASSRLGGALGTAGDVNGDGFADLVIGAPNYSDTQMQEGWAAVYYGAAARPATVPKWTAESAQSDTYFGFAVGTAGDLNADGYADVIVGAPYYDNGQTNEGRVFVYHGASAGLPASANWTAESDQDGGTSGTQFGAAAGTAGDVNGDGYSDVVVGAWRYDRGQTDEGRVFVWYGSEDGLGTNGTPANADWSAEGNQADGFFGYAAGTAGDVNGDGFSDLIVGQHGYNGIVGTDVGRVLVYLGSSAGLRASPAWMVEGDQTSAMIGNAVGTAGDVNGDGYSDVVVGANSYSSPQNYEGCVYVYHGSASGLSHTPATTIEGGVADAYLGGAVGTAGDVNGDGYSDLIVGASVLSADQQHEGRAYVYYGSAGGLGGTPWSVDGDQTDAYLGNAVGTAGDVNGDGYADVLVAAWRYDTGQTDAGRVYLYLGSPDGLGDEPDWTVEGDRANTCLGLALGTAGDVNGDGYADLIVGSGGYFSAGDATKQRALVFYGNGSGGRALVPRQAQADWSPLAPLGLTNSPGTVRLSLRKWMPLGRDRVRLQWQLAPLGVPFGTAGSGAVSGSTTSWSDTGGLVVLPFNQQVTGLKGGAAYRWRVRLLYDPGNRLGQAAGPWLQVPWNAWTEQDFRTLPYTVYLPCALRNYP